MANNTHSFPLLLGAYSLVDLTKNIQSAHIKLCGCATEEMKFQERAKGVVFLFQIEREGLLWR